MRRTHLFALALSASLAVTQVGSFAESPAGGGPQTPESALAERRAAVDAKASKLSAAELAREHYTVGVWAREQRLEDAARAEFKAAIAADPGHEPSHAALGDVKIVDVKLGEKWVPFDEAMKAKGLVFRQDRWVLREEAEILDLPAKERALRSEQHAKVAKLLGTYANGAALPRKLALESLGTIEDRFKLEPMAYALRAKSKDVRVLAAQELGRLANRRALKPLIYRAINDDDETVRGAAVDAAVAIGDANLAAPFVKALASEDAEKRMAAAVALARIGDARSVRYLVWRLEAYGGGGARGFSFFGNQLTYIQDFDVEVAQTAFIADPVVGTIQEGIVLDAQVVGTQQISEWVEREVYYGALAKLTGETDVKKDTASWVAWWREHGEEFEKKALAAK